jgi:hypothetical protein
LTAQSVFYTPPPFASPGRLSFGKDAAQSPYPDWHRTKVRNIVNSRDIMCNFAKIFCGCLTKEKNTYIIQNKENFMTDMAQIDKIILEVNTLGDKEKIILFHKMEKLFDDSDDQSDEEITLESAFGLWKDRNITKESLREKAWRQN